jgi:type II secretory pathway pseudopilin PulG
MPSNVPASKRAFTIPEMLAVVAIIMIIISILLPNLSSAKEAGRNIVCKNQQRQIGMAMMSHAVDNKSSLPGSYLSPWSWDEPGKRCWIGKEAYPEVPYDGALVTYLSGISAARETYRCPSLAKGVYGSGVGSNGRFDYCSLLVFAGAKKFNVPGSADYIDPTSGIKYTTGTPLIVEEDPFYYLNNGNIEPGHSASDRTGTWHNGAGNYVAFDGHSVTLKPDGKLGPTAFDWSAKTPTGATANLSSHGSGWGGWNTR